MCKGKKMLKIIQKMMKTLERLKYRTHRVGEWLESLLWLRGESNCSLRTVVKFFSRRMFFLCLYDNQIILLIF